MLKYRRLLTWLVLAATGAWLAGAGGYVRVRSAGYTWLREYRRAALVAAADPWLSRESAHFTVYYAPYDAEAADMVLEAAEAAYRPVVDALGHAPPGKTLVLVDPDRESLRRAFGWAQGESATGVYYGGVIRVLSPSAWVMGATPEQRRAAFRRLNPLTHEFTHLVLDYQTDGNYPRWFTEGLAQRLEYHRTGYRWLEHESTLRQRLYRLSELDQRFDRLPNQALAYRQSHLLVDHLVDRCGEAGLRRLLARLSARQAFPRALEGACGFGPEPLERSWRQWVQAHLDDLDAAVPRRAP